MQYFFLTDINFNVATVQLINLKVAEKYCYYSVYLCEFFDMAVLFNHKNYILT